MREKVHKFKRRNQRGKMSNLKKFIIYHLLELVFLQQIQEVPIITWIKRKDCSTILPLIQIEAQTSRPEFHQNNLISDICNFNTTVIKKTLSINQILQRIIQDQKLLIFFQNLLYHHCIVDAIVIRVKYWIHLSIMMNIFLLNKAEFKVQDMGIEKMRSVKVWVLQWEGSDIITQIMLLSWPEMKAKKT